MTIESPVGRETTVAPLRERNQRPKLTIQTQPKPGCDLRTAFVQTHADSIQDACQSDTVPLVRIYDAGLGLSIRAENIERRTPEAVLVAVEVDNNVAWVVLAEYEMVVSRTPLFRAPSHEAYLQLARDLDLESTAQ